MQPQDGSGPFFVQATHDLENMDTDDNFSAWPASTAFDQQGNEVIPSSERSSTDKRFIWTTLQPEVRPTLAKRGFAVEGADTLISLSPEDEDSLLVRGSLLATSHPMFAAAFDSRWAKGELENHLTIPAGTLLKDGAIIKYLYELELEDDGDTALVPKTKPTPSQERQSKLDHAAAQYEAMAHDRPLFDEWYLRENYAYLFARPEMHQTICIAAQKVGIAMLCGFPLTIYQNCGGLGRFLQVDEGEDMTLVVLVLKIVDWIHTYGSFRAMGPQTARFILKYFESCMSLELHPYTFLRVAKLMQDRDLFREAMAASVEQYWRDSNTYTNSLPLPLEDLAKSLGHDYVLVHQVVAMQDTVVRRVEDVDAALSRLGGMNEGHAATVRFATEAWREWYNGNSEEHKVCTFIAQLGKHTVSVETVLGFHQRFWFAEGEAYPPENVDRDFLSLAMSRLIRKAEKIVGELDDGTGRCFEHPSFDWLYRTLLQFETVVYPWEIALDEEPTKLSIATDNVAPGDTV